MIKRRGAPRLTYHLSHCSVSSRVVVMVQWLAHLTCNPGNAGSIPTHGICVFHSKWISQYIVLALDYIVGFPVLPVLHSKYITNCKQYSFGLVGLSRAVLMSRIEVKVIKPPQMSQTCCTFKPRQSVQTT